MKKLQREPSDREKIERAIIEVYRKLLHGESPANIDIETPWPFNPPGLYPTVHVYGTMSAERLITIKIVESV